MVFNIRAGLILALAAVAIVSFAAHDASAAIYMKISPINGPVTSTGFQNDIPLTSMQFGLAKPVAHPSGVQEVGRPVFSDLVVGKQMDIASPQLLEGLIAGRSFPTVEIYLTTTSNRVQFTYNHITLSNVVISHYSVSSSGQLPTETMGISYEKILTQYTQQNPDGSPGQVFSSCWDLVGDKECSAPASDTVPPTTTATLSGTAGRNGWYVSPVQVALSAADNAGGSGVRSTSYSLDGGPQVTYSAPFNVTGDGNHTLAFNSTDNAGNVEKENMLHIAIDTIPPTLAIKSPANGTIFESANLTVSGNASDDIDVASVTWMVDSGKVANATGTTNWSFNTGPMRPGPHEVFVNATDEAGNVAMSSLSVIYAAPTLTLQPPSGAAPIVFNAKPGGFTNLQSVQQSGLAIPPPPGIFPLGFFSWDVMGYEPATSVNVTVTSPAQLYRESQYFKLVGDAWIPLPVTVSGNNMTLTVSDNGPFDGNPVVGVISDPAAIADPTSGTVTGGGSIGRGTNFGLEVHSDLDKANPIKGTFEYHDRNSTLDISSNNITFLSVDANSTRATFVGMGTNETHDMHGRHDAHDRHGGDRGKDMLLVSVSGQDKTGGNGTLSITVINSTGSIVYRNSGTVRGHIEIKNEDVDDANSVVGNVTVGNTPEMLAFDRDDGKIYVANNADGTLSVIDGRTNSVASTIKVGSGPQGVAFDQRNGRVYVTNTGTSFDGNTVSVIDARAGKVTGTIKVGTGPIGVAFDGKNDRLYVANTNSRSVSVIDAGTDAVVATVPVGSGPNSVAVDDRANKVYVTNFFDGTVSVIDGLTNSVTGTIPVGRDPIDVAFDEKNGNVYVANFEDGTVSVIDGGRGILTGTVPVGSGPIGVTVDELNDNIYVGDSSSGEVSVIDAPTGEVVATLMGLDSPARGTVDTESGNIYVGNIGSDRVTVIGQVNPHGDGNQDIRNH
ncbi:MAG: type VI secretion system tube protein Hcp [Thaumarchaeota archaeon]|nr:type VI secretion system tube protein Hcp [Nitrososphaerota archaeon]